MDLGKPGNVYFKAEQGVLREKVQTLALQKAGQGPSPANLNQPGRARKSFVLAKVFVPWTERL